MSYLATEFEQMYVIIPIVMMRLLTRLPIIQQNI